MSYQPYTSDISSTAFNKVVHHPLQSYEWGRFREETGVQVIREVTNQEKLSDAFTVTLHPIPHTTWFLGYIPRGSMPTIKLIETLQKLGRERNCIAIQLEPDVLASSQAEKQILSLGLRPAVHPLFTKDTFQLDLTLTEDEILKAMHPKTRYNIRVAEKHGVAVQEDNSDHAFKKYLELTGETTRRQGFYAHTETYHKTQWNTLPHEVKPNQLSSHLFTATYEGKILTAWIVFVFHNLLYYPYGASSSENRETMSSTLMMWEVIRYGKTLGLKTFDMWGALGADPDPKDPWFGFHRFKSGFGPKPVEFVGSYDLVINPTVYKAYALADKLRWMYLKLKK